jgi:phage tail-like protein
MNYRPPVGYSFSVTFLNNGKFDIGQALSQNMFDVNFKEVSGLTSDITVEKLQEGGVLNYAHPLPKTGANFSNITMRRGLLIKSEIANWMYDALENFRIVPREIIIVLHGPLLVPIAAWNVIGAFPVKWEISAFNSMDNSIVIESLEFTCQKHRRILLESNESLLT